jgi:hypothetical protein
MCLSAFNGAAMLVLPKTQKKGAIIYRLRKKSSEKKTKKTGARTIFVSKYK